MVPDQEAYFEILNFSRALKIKQRKKHVLKTEPPFLSDVCYLFCVRFVVLLICFLCAVMHRQHFTRLKPVDYVLQRGNMSSSEGVHKYSEKTNGTMINNSKYTLQFNIC